LPFVNMSGDPDNEYFSDGLSEELLNALAGVPGLFVAARTSSFHFKGSTGDIADIARQLRVRNVLEGSVRSSGDRVRITAQLIDASNGYHLWSDTFDRTLDDVFAVQDEISSRVAEALKVALLNEPDAAPDRPTDNTEAYLAYLRGQQYSNEGGVKGYTRAIDEYQRAVTLDPDFAEAYAGIAMAWAQQLGWGNLSRAEAAPHIREAADRALAIDPNLPLAWTADALAIFYSGPDTRDDPRVLATLERALAMEPGNVVILSYYASALESANQPEKAIEALQKGLARDPLSAVLHNQLGGAYLVMGQTDKARRSLLTALELKPGLASAADGLASVARQRSQFAEAIIWQQDVITSDPRDTYSRSLVVFDYLELGDLQRAREWQAVADEMDADAPMTRGSRALLLWFEGDPAAAAAEARRFYADGLKGSQGAADLWMRYVLFLDRLDAAEPQAALDILLNDEAIPAEPLPGSEISFRDAARLARALPALAQTEGTAVAQSKAQALLAYTDRAQGQPGWSPGRVAILRCSVNVYLGRTADAIRSCEQELGAAGMGTYLGLQIGPKPTALAGADAWQNFMDRIGAERAAQLASLRESGKEPTPH
jgi:TolB-like protein/cytochrome c-type biogenesis protein CcmH/NrfG